MPITAAIHFNTKSKNMRSHNLLFIFEKYAANQAGGAPASLIRVKSTHDY